MKLRPASKSVGNFVDQVLVGLVCTLFAVLSVLILISSDQNQASGAGLMTEPTGTVPTVSPTATVPTVSPTSTVPTVSPTATAPTGTVSPTATGVTLTPTATKTPVPSAHDKRLQLVDAPLTGNYCVVTGGKGLTANNDGRFDLTIDGNVVAAYLVWAGRYLGAGNGDDTVKISLNDGPLISISAAVAMEAFSGWENRNHYTYRSADLVNNSDVKNALTGTVNVKVLDLKSSNNDSDQGYGIGMIVVYENATNCAESEVNIFYGLDGFHHRFSPPFGPHSEVLCVDVPAAGEAQTLEFQLFVGGAEGDRHNAIWYTTGTGTKPTELISNSTGTFLDGSQLPGDTTPALTAANGQQWDVYSNSVVVPAGHTYACLQIESVVPLDPPTSLQLDTPADIAFDTSPYGTSGVWASMVSRLLAGIVTPTPTSTATLTPTNTPDVPTATATPSATATATLGATATASTTATATATTPATPTPTVTITPTQVPTLTPTVTPTGTRTPNLIFTITSEPSPPHPGMPLTFTIRFQNGPNGPVKQLTFTVIVPNSTEYGGSVARLQSAGWQCAGVTAGSKCTYVVGDVATSASGAVDFPVDVAESAPLNAPITLNVVGTDQNGNAFSGGLQGIDHEVTISAVNLYLPYIGKNWSR